MTIDGAPETHAVVMSLDWQFTASNDEMLGPARDQYRRRSFSSTLHWGEALIAYCTYIFVDNDAAVMRGFVQGFPKKLGSIFQTRSDAAPSSASGALRERVADPPRCPTVMWRSRRKPKEAGVVSVG